MLYPEILAYTFSGLTSLYAFKKRSVTVSGLMSMLVISSYFIGNNGIGALSILFAMFATATLLTKFKHEYKAQLTDKVLKKHGPRDAIQALCNLGIALLCFILYTYTHNAVFQLALVCSVAASNADSWASEIGILSKQHPVLLTNFKTCKPGISGGITLLGTLAGISGSIFIALISVALKPMLSLELSTIHLFSIVSIAGISGLFVDSILGATLQIVYKDAQEQETENVLWGTTKSRGIPGFNNDWVNFTSTCIVAASVVLIFTLVTSD